MPPESSPAVPSGFWGIEIWHPKHSAELVDRCPKLAGKYQLACTRGSDFHGRYGEGEPWAAARP